MCIRDRRRFSKICDFIGGIGSDQSSVCIFGDASGNKKQTSPGIGSNCDFFPDLGNERWILLAGVAAPYAFPCHYAVICGDSSQKKTVWLENGIIGIFDLYFGSNLEHRNRYDSGCFLGGITYVLSV